MDNVPEGYVCGRPSDVAFLIVARGDGGLVGVWFTGFPASPFVGSASDLVRTKRRGLAAGLWGSARLAAHCAGPPWRCSVRTHVVGPMSQRLGAYRCVGLCLAVALTSGPFKGVPYQKGTLEGNCAVVCRSLELSGSWSRPGGFAGPGRTVWRVHPV